MFESVQTRHATPTAMIHIAEGESSKLGGAIERDQCDGRLDGDLARHRFALGMRHHGALHDRLLFRSPGGCSINNGGKPRVGRRIAIRRSPLRRPVCARAARRRQLSYPQRADRARHSLYFGSVISSSTRQMAKSPPGSRRRSASWRRECRAKPMTRSAGACCPGRVPPSSAGPNPVPSKGSFRRRAIASSRWISARTGNFALAAFVHRFTAGCVQALAAIGATASYLETERRGYSTFELALQVTGLPRLGSVVLVETGIVHLGNSSIRLRAPNVRPRRWRRIRPARPIRGPARPRHETTGGTAGGASSGGRAVLIPVG